MRKLSPQRRRAVLVPAAVCCMTPALRMLSERAHTPLNDAVVGVGVGLLLGMCGMSLVLLRRANACEKQSQSPE